MEVVFWTEGNGEFQNDDEFGIYSLVIYPYIVTHDAQPETQALILSRADKIFISALFASALVRNKIYPPVDEGC